LEKENHSEKNIFGGKKIYYAKNRGDPKAFPKNFPRFLVNQIKKPKKSSKRKIQLKTPLIPSIQSPQAIQRKKKVQIEIHSPLVKTSHIMMKFA
jgi:hypothetical protein